VKRFITRLRPQNENDWFNLLMFGVTLTLTVVMWVDPWTPRVSRYFYIAIMVILAFALGWHWGRHQERSSHDRKSKG
jgi:MFS superfamily sulfate permease-like transporter